jgi:hypothetical protein
LRRLTSAGNAASSTSSLPVWPNNGDICFSSSWHTLRITLIAGSVAAYAATATARGLAVLALSAR